jgi:hypothetical protein
LRRTSQADPRWELAIGVLILAAIIADPVVAPAPAIHATDASWVSTFDLMAKADDLPAERFEAI